MKDSSINTLSFGNDFLAKRFVESNGIKNAFIYKEPCNPTNRRWQVLEGNESTLSGWTAGEFRTKKAAKMFCDKLNEKIKFVLAL